MASRLVIFPADKEAEALAYMDFVNAEHELVRPGDRYADHDIDFYGQHVVAFYGPPFALGGVTIVEPAGGPALRAAGVLHSSYVWPIEE